MGKKSKATTTQTIYGNTTTRNPYVISKTDNKGTVSEFNQGSAFDSINKFVNNNMERLLQEYMNPTLDSVTNQSKLNSFVDNLNKVSAYNFENNIINPLSRRNMIRSSQATNLYNNLLSNNNNQLAQYAGELLSSSQKETASMLANLMLMYMNGYSAVSDTQAQSLKASQGNATRINNGSDSSVSASDSQQMMQMLTSLVMLAEGL